MSRTSAEVIVTGWDFTDNVEGSFRKVEEPTKGGTIDGHVDLIDGLCRA